MILDDVRLGTDFKEKVKIQDKFIDIYKDQQILNSISNLRFFRTNYKRKEISQKQGNLKIQIELNNGKIISLTIYLENKMRCLKKWKNVIIKCYCDFKTYYNMDIRQFYRKNYISSKPFESASSKLLFRAIKEGKTDISINMVKQNPFLVQNFDYVIKS